MKKIRLTTTILVISLAFLFNSGEALAAKNYRLVKTANDAKVFLVDNNRRVHISNPSVFEAGGYKWKDIKVISETEMDKITNTALIKSPVDAKVYLIKDGAKQWIPNEETFLSAGLKWSDIIVISQAQVDFYNETEFNPQSILEIVKPESSTLPDDSTENAESEKKQNSSYVKPDKEQITEVGNLRSESPYTIAFGINNNGDVVGYSMKTGEDSAHPFLFKDGVMKDIGNGYSGIANAVNDNGQVVGQLNISFDSGTGGGVKRAFLWEDGKITKLGTSPGVASDINNKKQVVGYMWIGETDGFPMHAFIWEKGVMKDLGTLGGNDYAGATQANAINNSGQVVGCSVATKEGIARPFLWENGKMEDLGDLYNLGGCAIDINDSGQVLGYFSKKNKKNDSTGKEYTSINAEAFLWEKGIFTPFVGAPAGFSPRKINNNGDVLGSGYGVIIGKKGEYYNYRKIDDWWINSGTGFNDNGQIVARGSTSKEDGTYAIRLSLPENLDSQFKIETD